MPPYIPANLLPSAQLIDHRAKPHARDEWRRTLVAIRSLPEVQR